MTKKSSPKYEIKIEVLKEEWTASGKTIEQALSKFELDWNDIKGKGMVYVSYGDKKLEKLMTMPQLRRIMSNKITRGMWAKNFQLLLN